MQKLNKKGIELQVNFVVILILTLIIFGSSIMIAYKILNSTNKLKDQVDATTQARLESLLINGNDEVVIPFNKKDDLNKGDSAVFGVGIVNMLGTNTEFQIKTTLYSAFDSTGNPVPDTGAWTYSYSGSNPESVGFINNNDHKIINLVFIPKTVTPGNTYVFNVEVFYNCDSTCKPYPARDRIKKIRITIKN